MLRERGSTARKRRPTTSYARINGKCVELYSLSHLCHALGICRTDAQRRFRDKQLPPPLIASLMRLKSNWRWYTAEELMEYKACAMLHRTGKRLYWKRFEPDIKQRVEYLKRQFKAGALPLWDNPSAVEFYRRIDERKARRRRRLAHGRTEHN